VKGHTYGTVSYIIDTHSPTNFAPVLSQTPDTTLTAPSDETGNLIGYLEWAEPVIQESGAKFYMMRVCLIVELEVKYPFTNDHSTATSTKSYTLPH
jgi:hypothetical protein